MALKDTYTMCISLFIVCLVSILTSCNGNTNEIIFWEDYKDDYTTVFNTNDLDRAIVKTQFPIILPTYLPTVLSGYPSEDLNNHTFPFIRGSCWNDNNTKWDLIITYCAKDEQGIIHQLDIIEKLTSNNPDIVTSMIDILKSHHIEYKLLYLANLEVLYVPNFQESIWENYYFSINDVAIELHAENIKQEDVLKIIQSMY